MCLTMMTGCPLISLMWAIEIMKERVKSGIISFLLKGDLLLLLLLVCFLWFDCDIVHGHV